MRYRIKEIISILEKYESEFIEDKYLINLITPQIKNIDFHIASINKKLIESGYHWYYIRKSLFARDLGISRVTLDRWIYLGIVEQYKGESMIDTRKTLERLKELKNKKLYKNRLL